ncbi:conserved repeat domain-containing protein/gliding motility-associated C-terminal domain-containing protein [Zunongwangia mangrovi]|uniref:Conserved repeat domain-containing protein/gliding motility-associated C-terminal domain-containing protein n=1 Tax=Zunongwangia mangrovi TaxID=1334022 RepID=A0A1I1HE84_9FLAO|nr:gliding motility-associated C-terminal domain-containing protein [Zunongwangia mangrovi]SFC22479.1 conserved repeat domain-containing protein/gliding motility-associated C-terminal domain-containing protein [Zunongwangia mangrovi]
MELSLPINNKKLPLILVVFNVLFFSITFYAQTSTQRIYATNAEASADEYSLLGILSGSVDNVNAATDSDLTTFATLNSTVVNALGGLISIGGEASIKLNFTESLQANTPVTIKLGLGGDVLSALSGVYLQGINDTDSGESNAGEEIILGDLVGALTGNQQLEVIITPDEDFNGVKISLGVPEGLLNVGVLTTVDVYEAFYEESSVGSGCIDPVDALVGIEGELLDLNLLSALDVIQNPYNAIDGDPNSAALLRANVSALTSAYLNVPFNGASKPGDQIQIILEDQAAGILDLSLLSSNFQVIALNDKEVVQTFNASSSLLSLELLSGSSSKYLLSLPVSDAFDEVEIRYAGSLATVFSGINIYEVGTAPPSPVIISDDLNAGIASICEGKEVSLFIENPIAGSVYNWYTQVEGGTIVATTTSFTPQNLTDGTYDYYVAQSRPGCIYESARVKVTIEVEDLPTTPVLVESNIEVASGGDVTFEIENPDTNITYNWYAEGDASTIVHTGETYALTDVTASAGYTVIGVSAAGCESLGADVTVTVLDNLLPPTVAPEMATISEGETQTYMASSENPDPVEYAWYDDNGVEVFVGENYTTPTDLAPGDYTYDVISRNPDTGQESIPTTVTLTVLSDLLPPTVTPEMATISEGETQTFMASSENPDPVEYAWYNDNGVEVFVGENYTTPSDLAPGDYTYDVISRNPDTGQESTPTTASLTVEAVEDLTDCTAANAQNNGIDGLLCVLCGVSNAGNSVDNDPNNFARLRVSVGVSASVYQELIFPNSGIAGDSIRVDLGIPGGLADVSVLSGLQVTLSNGNTQVDQYTLNSSLVRLTLLGGERFSAQFEASGVYDRVEIRNLGLVNALESTDIYGAYIEVPDQIIDYEVTEICSGESVNFNIETQAGLSYIWFDSESGDNQMANGGSYTTSEIESDQTFFLEISRNGCPIQNIIPFEVQVLPTATESDLVTMDYDICVGGNVELEATTSVPNATIRYYADADLTNEIIDLTVMPTTTTTYYVTVSGDGVCENLPGDAAMITVNVSDPGTPITDMPMQSFCGDATIADLMTNEGNVVWYADGTGGDILDESMLLENGTYYAGFDPASGCASSELLAVTVELLPTATESDLITMDYDICVGGSVALEATTSVPNATIRYYADADLTNEITDLTVMPTSTTTYYATVSGDGLCENLPGEAAMITVSVSDPGTPTTDMAMQSFCGDATIADLMTNEGNVVWYADEDGTTILSDTEILVNGTYYAGFDPASGCASSELLAVTVEILPTATESDLVTMDYDICVGGSVELEATTSVPNATIRYYADADLTNEITDLTVMPTSTTTYYVTLSRDGVCENPPGEAAMITVSVSDPGTPTTDMPIQSFCGDATIADLMTNEGNVVWYADEDGTTILSDTEILVNGTYYAGFDPTSGCASSELLAVSVELLPTATESDLVTMDYDICAGGSVELEATTSVSNATIRYYADAELTTEITDLTVTPTSTTTYYVTVSGDGVCENLPGEAAMITVSVSDPGTPTTDMAMQSFCSSATIADLMTNEDNVVWYADETGGDILDESMLLENGTYYAGFDPSSGCASSELLAVSVEILPTATESDLVTIDYDICVGGSVALETTTSVSNATLTYYADADLTNEITDLEVSPTVTTTYYVTLSGDGVCENLPGDAAMITVSVSDPGTPTTDMAMQSFCGDATIADLLTNEGNVVWYADETGGDILDAATSLQDGMTYYAGFDPTSGCASSELLAITVELLPTATASDLAVNDSFICSGGNVMLTATSSVANPVFRYYSDAELNSEITDLTVMPTTTTTYYVTVSGDGVCENLPGEVATLQVIVSDPGTPTTTLPNQSFCAGATVADIQVNESNVIWYASADSSSPLAQNTQLENGMTYYAGFDPASGCSSSQRLAVTVSLLTDVVASIDGLFDGICLMEEVTYTTEPGKEDYLWDIDGGEITAGGGLSDNSVTVRWTSVLNTSVSVSYMDTGSCSAEVMEMIDINVVNCSDLAMSASVDNFSPMIGEEVTFTIRVDNLGDVDFNDIVIRSMLPEGYRVKSVTSVKGQFSMVNRNWKISMLQANASAEARIVAEVTDEDDYMKVVELMSSIPADPNASNNRAQITVNPLCLMVYNEFTPNNDGSNDVFRIDCIENYPNNKLEVYNRYGDLVFETSGYQNNWDGTANRGAVLTNKPLPVGTYYYVLQVDGRGEIDNVNMQGWLYIMR